MNTSDLRDRLELNRRQVLQALGVTAGATFIAGCTKANPGGGGSDGKGGNGGAQGAFHTAYPYDAPPKGNFNLLGGVPESILALGYLSNLIMLPGATYYWDAQKYYYLLADESSKLSADGKTFIYIVRKGLTWSDGKPITAQDVYTTWLLRYITGHSAFTYVDKFEKTDNMTVTFHIKQPTPMVQYWLLEEQIVADSVYGKYGKQAEPMVKALKPTTNKAMATLSASVNSFKPKAVVASGPFNFDTSSVTNAQLTLVQNPRGYRAKKIHFTKVVVYNGTSAADITPPLLAKEIDYCTYALPVATEKEVVQEGMRILRPPTYYGQALYMNMGKHKEFADKRVRQALAYAIDRAQDAEISLGKSGKACKLMAGISDDQVPQWLPATAQTKLDQYALDLKKAESLLVQTGWKKLNGKWMTPQGQPAAYTLSFPSQYPDWSGSATDVADQLNSFGFKITLKGEDVTVEPVDIAAGKFDLAIQAWGSAGNPFPTGAYTLAFLTNNYPTTAPQRGIDFLLKQKTDVAGMVDLAALVPDSATGSLDDLKRKTTEVALVFNELLPIIPLVERYGNNPVLTTAITGFPPDPDPIYKNYTGPDNFVTILMYQGVLAPA